MAEGLNNEQRLELANDVVSLMESIVRTEAPAGFDVKNATMSFYLGDSVGELVGQWKITVEFLGLD